MTRILFSLLFALLPQIALAQSNDSLILGGKKAAEFSVNGLNLGGALGARRWYDDDHFIRASLSTSYASSLRNEPLDSLEWNRESKNIRFGFDVSWGFRLFSAERLIGYSGVAASVSYEDSRYIAQRLGDGYSTRSIDRGVGVGLFAGFEYFITEIFSLSGEKVVSGTWTFDSDQTRYFNFGNGNSSLRLSVYF